MRTLLALSLLLPLAAHAQPALLGAASVGGPAPASYAYPSGPAPTAAFEDNGGTDWTSLAQEETFAQAVLSGSPRVDRVLLGQSGQGRDIYAYRIGSTGPPSWADLEAAGAIVIVSTAHGHEPAPREAALQLLRDLAWTEDADLLAYLDAHPVVIIPTPNPDGREANTRNTASGINLNRDQIALESPELQAVTVAFREAQPHLIIDAHEHFDALTEDVSLLWPVNAQVDAALAAASEAMVTNDLLPAVELEGYTTGKYIENPLESLLSNAAGLRHAYGLLIETPTSESNKEARVAVQLATMVATLDFHAGNDAAMAGVVSGSASRKTAEGANQSAAFDLGNGVLLNPPPAGYQLTTTQWNTSALHRDRFGIAGVPYDGGYYVTMGQEAQPVIPFIMDPSATYAAVAATRVATEPADL